ncbi:MAG: hypothetical protein HY690_06365 [Chloroflexi bacterium]|nr:hypothetical protein [Chloroflexota bacterium]
MATFQRKTPVPAADEARAAEQASALLEAAEQEPAAAVRELEALDAGEPELALATVAALGRVEHARAALALAAIAESQLGKELRKEARRSLHRLRAAGVEVPWPAALEAPPAPPPKPRAALYAAWASAPDGVGSRLLWLMAERPLGGIYALGLLMNDVVGLKDASLRESTRKRFEVQLDEWRQRPGMTWVRLPAEYASQLVGEALALNQRSGFPVPSEFQVSRDLIEGLERPFERALVYQEISPGTARLAPDWLQQSSELLREPELASWAFNYDAVRPFTEQHREIAGGRLIITPQRSPQSHEQLVSEAITTVLTPELRQALKRRLEEMASVFLHTERPRQARLAVAAAVTLETARVSVLLLGQSQLRLDQHPLVRAMMERSLELAEVGEEAVPEFMQRSPDDPVPASAES